MRHAPTAPRIPRKPGFFCGVKNIAQGTYDERQTALRSEAQGSEAVARQRSDELRTLQSQEASLAIQKKAFQKKLATAQADIDKQKRLLANARLRQRTDRDKLNELETQLKTLQGKRTWLGESGGGSFQEVENLKLDIARLQGRIDEELKRTAVE